MSEPRFSDENKAVFQTIVTVFGGKASVDRPVDENQKSSINLVTVVNSPRDSINSYATIGLSDHSIGITMGTVPLGVEIVGACHQTYAHFPKIIAACTLKVIQSTAKFHPGAVFKDIIPAFYPDMDMKHILFVPPYGWDHEFLTLQLPTKWVGWLMALPISDAELKFYNETESGELESRFEEKQIDVYDLKRSSIL
jgi:antitoxin YqcF